MQNFLKGSTEARRTDVNIEELMNTLFRLYMMHNPLEQLINPTSEQNVSIREQTPNTRGDRVPVKKRMDTLPLDTEYFKSTRSPVKRVG